MFTRITASASARFRTLVRNEEGATAVEYGLIVGLIAVVLVAAVAGLSGALGGMFDGIAEILTNPQNELPPAP